MERQKQNIKSFNKINSKGTTPIVSSKLPQDFFKSGKTRSRANSHQQIEKSVNQTQEDQQEEKQAGTSQKQNQVRMSSSLKTPSIKDSQIEKIILKIKKGLPDFSQQKQSEAKIIKKVQVRLQEIITLSVVKENRNSGVVRKVLHAPTLRIFAVKEVPLLRENKVQIQE